MPNKSPACYLEVHHSIPNNRHFLHTNLCVGMYVLGVFIVSQTNVTTTPTLPPKLKSILAQINKTVSAEGFMFSTPANSERLILGFNTQTQQSSCRYYDVGTMAVKNGDLKVAAQDGRWWTQLSCRLELDQVLRIGSEQSSNWPLKKKFHVCGAWHNLPFPFMEKMAGVAEKHFCSRHHWNR